MNQLACVYTIEERIKEQIAYRISILSIFMEHWNSLFTKPKAYAMK